MKRLFAITVSAVSVVVFAQGRLAYESTVDEKIKSIESKANDASAKATAVSKAVSGDDFVIVVTNYDSVTKMPAASFRFKLDSGDGYRVVWNELDRWNWFFNKWFPSNSYDKAGIAALLDTKADRSWGIYESYTGAKSPDGRLWISQGVTISSGMAYQPYSIDAVGSIWVLESNGLEVSTSTNGFLNISDDEGNSVFRIEKGDKKPVGALAGAITKNGNVITVPYPVKSTRPPNIEGRPSLSVGEWETLPNGTASVTWEGESGAWVAKVTLASVHPSYFLRAWYEVGTATKIVNKSATSFEGGIVIDGERFKVGKATLASGETVLTLTSLGKEKND